MANWGHRNNRAMSSDVPNEMLAQQNQLMADNLAKKVSRLRDLAVDMENDAKDSNRYLDNMGSDFDGTTGLLSGSMKRINNMLSSGKSNRRLMCYLICILVVTFLVLFYVISWFRSS